MLRINMALSIYSLYCRNEKRVGLAMYDGPNAVVELKHPYLEK